MNHFQNLKLNRGKCPNFWKTKKTKSSKCLEFLIEAYSLSLNRTNYFAENLKIKIARFIHCLINENSANHLLMSSRRLNQFMIIHRKTKNNNNYLFLIKFSLIKMDFIPLFPLPNQRIRFIWILIVKKCFF